MTKITEKLIYIHLKAFLAECEHVFPHSLTGIEKS